MIFKKKPPLVQAAIFDGTNTEEIQAFCPNFPDIRGFDPKEHVGYYIVRDGFSNQIIHPDDFPSFADPLDNSDKGRIIVGEIIDSIKADTETKKSQIIEKLNSVFTGLIIGELDGAKKLVDVLIVDEVLTAEQKTIILDKIDGVKESVVIDIQPLIEDIQEDEK